MMGVLNHRLPSVCREKYGAIQDLQIRTGRFANSARITDIGVTTQGVS